MYIFSRDIQEFLAEKQKQLEAKQLTPTNDDWHKIFGTHPYATDLEKDIISDLVRDGRIYCYEIDENNEFCHVLHSYSSLLRCNSIYMDRYLDQESGAFYYENLNLSSEEVNRIANTKTFVQKSAIVSPDALLGPNVYIGKGVKIGPGVRIKNSIILGGTEIYGYAMVSNTIIGWNCKVGPWARLEGESIESDKTVNVLGVGVTVESENFICNCIVLPYKIVSSDHKNETII